jgi:hypothetical protein
MKPRTVGFLLSLFWGFTSTAALAAPHVFRDAGVSFLYDDAVLKKPKAHREKALQLAFPTDVPEGVAPAHVQVRFGKDQGKLWVFPTSDGKVKDFREAYPPHAIAHKQLRLLLRDRPAESKEMPVLPWADVGVPFNKKIRYLAFRNGSGVAWLTQWTVDSAPINNSQLWYVFQGLTKDGAHYVAAQFHVVHSSLPATPQVQDWQTFEKHYPAYLAKAAKEIAAQSDDSFQPSLAKLRAMFVSIEVVPVP